VDFASLLGPGSAKGAAKQVATAPATAAAGITAAPLGMREEAIAALVKGWGRAAGAGNSALGLLKEEPGLLDSKSAFHAQNSELIEGLAGVNPLLEQHRKNMQLITKGWSPHLVHQFQMHESFGTLVKTQLRLLGSIVIMDQEKFKY